MTETKNTKTTEDERAEVEALERQVENIERVVAPPEYDRLMPYASATT